MSRYYSPNTHSQISSSSAKKKRPSWLLAVVCAAGVGLAPIYAHGQKAPQKSAIQIYHKPLTEKTLPAPGQSMTIAAELFGTKEISLPLRLVAVRDGRLLPAPLTNSYRNAADRPVYEFEMPAPMAEISYQFVLPIPATTTGAASTPGSVT